MHRKILSDHMTDYNLELSWRLSKCKSEIYREVRGFKSYVTIPTHKLHKFLYGNAWPKTVLQVFQRRMKIIFSQYIKLV